MIDSGSFLKSMRPGLIGLAVMVTLAGLAVAVLLFLPARLEYRSEFKIGNEIVTKVEAFRISHGRLPETLDDVGMGNPDLNVYYRKVDETDYLVWFGTTLGESETYDSNVRKWE